MDNGLVRAARIEDALIHRSERRHAPPPEPIRYEGGGVTCFRREDAPVVRPTATPVEPMPTATVMCAAPALVLPEPPRAAAPMRTDLVGFVGWDFARPAPRLSKKEKRRAREMKEAAKSALRLERRLAAVSDRAINTLGWTRGELQRAVNSGRTAWGLARLEALIASLEEMSR